MCDGVIFKGTTKTHSSNKERDFNWENDIIVFSTGGRPEIDLNDKKSM